MPFKNRKEAGRKLAAVLALYKGERPVVLALPRGGVPVAAEVAAALDAPLDLLIVRKIGVPDQPELAMGAIVDGPAALTVRNEDVIRLAGVSETEFESVRQQELAEIERRRASYVGERPHPQLADHTVIVIDDGIATGATTRAGLRAVRARNPRKLIIAVPVAPTDTIELLREEADEVVCLEQHDVFGAIGFYYADFRQVSDQEVIEALKRHPVRSAPSS